MRRAIALSMLMLFSWTLLAPILAPSADATLPACCRRNGKHRCNMRTMAPAGGDRRGFSTVSEKCPCRPSAASVVRSSTFEPEAASLFYAEVRRHPAQASQTEALFRLSARRSHQKRGPPSPLA
jgi:hypothetical protein